MAVRPRLPLPGKVVPVVEGEVLKKVILISVEEHVDNCAAFLGFVSRDENQPGRKRILADALLFHDIGKKLFRVRAMYRDTESAALRKWGWDSSRDEQENVVDFSRGTTRRRCVPAWRSRSRMRCRSPRWLTPI